MKRRIRRRNECLSNIYMKHPCKFCFRKFHGPHICGDALDIDPIHNHILTGSWRKTAVLQIWDFAMAVKIKDVPQDSITSSQVLSV